MTSIDRQLRVEVFCDLADSRLKEAWNWLQQFAARHDPFTSSWWSQANPVFPPGVEPCIVVAWDGEHPCALVNLGLMKQRKTWTLVAWASVHRDTMDVLMIRAGQMGVIDAMCEALPWSRIGHVRIDGIPADSPLCEAMRVVARRHGLRGGLYLNKLAPFCSLLDTQGQRYKDSRGIFRGKRHRQLQKQFMKMGKASFDKPQSENQIDGLLDCVFFLHQKRWVGTYTPSSFSDPGHRERIRRVAHGAFTAGALHLSVLRLDGQAIAGALGYVLGNRYYFHIVAVDCVRKELSSMRTYLSYLIDDLLMHTGVECFDYLEGDDSYKSDHCTGTRELMALTMSRHWFSSLCMQGPVALESWLRAHPRMLALARTTKRKVNTILYDSRCRIRR